MALLLVGNMSSRTEQVLRSGRGARCWSRQVFAAFGPISGNFRQRNAV